MIVLRALQAFGRSLWHLLQLLRESRSDLAGTYPDQPHRGDAENAQLHAFLSTPRRY